MKGFDRAQTKVALSLFVVALLSASLLALVDQVTQAPIAEAQRAALHKNLVQVLPKHANDPLQDMFTFPLSETKQLQVFPAKNREGEVLAYAWEQIAADGYAGTIRILMGVWASGEVVAIRITHHRETPGLGDGITDDMHWLQSFVDKTLLNSVWAVRKDGGDFDQFTGATITPRAVVKAVQQGLVMYNNSSDALLKAEKMHQKKRQEQQLERQVAGDESS